MPFSSHHIRARGAEIAREHARLSGAVQPVELMGIERERAGGEAAGSVGEAFAGVAFIGQRGGGVQRPAARIALVGINMHAAGKPADFLHSHFDARGAIEMSTQIAPRGKFTNGPEFWELENGHGKG